MDAKDEILLKLYYHYQWFQGTAVIDCDLCCGSNQQTLEFQHAPGCPFREHSDVFEKIVLDNQKEV